LTKEQQARMYQNRIATVKYHKILLAQNVSQSKEGLTEEQCARIAKNKNDASKQCKITNP
jgi:hypothetical protein